LVIECAQTASVILSANMSSRFPSFKQVRSESAADDRAAMCKYVGYVVDVWVLLFMALMLVAIVEIIRAFWRKEGHPHGGLLMMTLFRVLYVVLFWPIATVLYVVANVLAYAVGMPLIGSILVWRKIFGKSNARMRQTAASEKAKAQKSKPRWRVSTITATPAKFVDFTIAPDAETAEQQVAEAHAISDTLRNQLVAIREE
jgi:hypothetical protein